MCKQELPEYPNCYVCGKSNDRGFQLTFFYNKEKNIIETEFFLDEHYIGYENIIHGGVISTILDEISAWSSMYLTKQVCVTSKLNIEFLLPVKNNRKYKAIAQMPIQKNEKTLIIHSEFLDERNRIYAKAEAEFIIMTGKRAEKMKKDLHLEEI